MLKRSTIWIDVGGFTTQTIMSTSTGGAGIEADMLAISNAGRADEWEAAPGGPAGAAAAATYESVGDYALLSFLCADGTIATLKIPAPQAGIFQADQVTVDITNAFVVALAASANGNLLSASGSAASSLLGGTRRRLHRDYA